MSWPILTARITEKNLPAGRETNHLDPKEILEEKYKESINLKYPMKSAVREGNTLINNIKEEAREERD